MNSTAFVDATRRVNLAAHAAGLHGAAWGTTPGARTMKRLKEGGTFIKVRIVDRTPEQVYADMVDGILAANQRDDPGLAASLIKEATA